MGYRRSKGGCGDEYEHDMCIVRQQGSRDRDTQRRPDQRANPWITKLKPREEGIGEDVTDVAEHVSNACLNRYLPTQSKA
jgi:hypothetical protein